MRRELLEMIEHEILERSGVSKEEMKGGTGIGGFRVPPATVYKFGRRSLGHVHDTGVADITFPKKVRNELISEGKAIPHPAGFEGVVNYRIREPEDVPDVVELFHIAYDLAKASAERREALRTG